MHYGDWHDGPGWWWAPMVLMMIAFWGGLAWVVVSLVRHSTRGSALPPTAPPTDGPGPRPGPDARQILAERLARGEIDVEDYRARLDALGPGLPHP